MTKEERKALVAAIGISALELSRDLGVHPVDVFAMFADIMLQTRPEWRRDAEDGDNLERLLDDEFLVVHLPGAGK